MPAAVHGAAPALQRPPGEGGEAAAAESQLPEPRKGG